MAGLCKFYVNESYYFCNDVLFNGLTQEEIDKIIDSEPLEDLDYEDYDDEFDEMENDDVDVIIDLELDPDIIEIE